MKIETLLGALVAAVIGGLTAFLALLNQAGVNGPGDISTNAWYVLLVGVALAFGKDFQALTSRRILSRFTGSGNVHSPAIVGILAVLLASLALSGCAGTRAAYSAAEGLEENAKVVGEHYYALVREANDLKDSGELSGSTLRTAQDLVRYGRPLLIELAGAARAYEAVRSADNAQALERALSNAAIAVSRLLDVIQRSRNTSNLLTRDPVALAA